MPRAKTQPKVTEDAQAVAEALVSRLYEDILRKSYTVFVGAGSTTEARVFGTRTFYDDIKSKAKYPNDFAPPSFPELMQYFCDHPDGGHHNRLIREAISRIEFFCLRADENRFATMFSDSLAKIPYFDRFVTTNWDPFLERSLDVLVPIVEDRDLAFWDDTKRQVLKIHGCITRPYSIVATQTDYENCMSANPLIFNKLKDLMATKTFLFAGYSMRDTDFRDVWDGINATLGRFAKLAYGLDRHATPEAICYWKDRGIQLFKTSDLLFIRSLRGRLEKEGLIPSEELLEFLHRERRRIASIHVRLRQNFSGGLASAMYQDGLLHGLDDVLTSTALGTKKKDDFTADLREAEEQLAQMQQELNLIEIAYWTGRHEVAKRFCKRSKTPIPAYFHPNRLCPLTKLIRGERL